MRRRCQVGTRGDSARQADAEVSNRREADAGEDIGG
jgi:hypothetical protein